MRTDVFILSDGCQPTEDLYFRDFVAPRLRKNGLINDKYINCKRCSPAQLLPQLTGGALLLVFRTLPERWIDALPKLSHGNRLVYILDDDLRAAQQTPDLPLAYRNRISTFAEQHLDRLLHQADELVVSSDHLAQVYAAHRPQTLHPSLAINAAKLSDFRRRPSVFYHATRSHEKDLEFLTPCLQQILASRSLRFESLIGDSTPRSLLDRQDVIARNPKSWRAFRLFQRLARRDIGLAPLLDTPYNRGKSHIKFLDIAAVGAVGIYSNRAPYANIIEHGVDGLLAGDDPAEWQQHLEYLLNHPEQAATMAKRAQAKAMELGHPKHSYRFWRRLLQPT